MVGLFQEVGPCQVIEVARGQLGTIAREWGWDRSSNIVFIDQPVQVGFSYDQVTNASLNLIDEVTDLSSYIVTGHTTIVHFSQRQLLIR